MIRSATAGDAAAIAEIWNHIIRDTIATFNSAEKTEAEVATIIAARQAAGRAFFVADDAGEVLGFATYDQFRGGVGYKHSMEHTVLLSPKANGRGIGRALMTAIEDHARKSGAHVMVAGVAGENIAGRDFHLALGYQLVGTMPQVGFKFGRFMDLWLLQKILT